MEHIKNFQDYNPINEGLVKDLKLKIVGWVSKILKFPVEKKWEVLKDKLDKFSDSEKINIVKSQLIKKIAITFKKDDNGEKDLKWITQKINDYKKIEKKPKLSEELRKLAEKDKTNEGTTFKDTKKSHEKSDAYGDKKEDFRGKLESYVKSLSCKTKEVGSDFEIHFLGKHIGQVMFRKDFISVKKVGDKFDKQFKYVELGKIKSEISRIIKDIKDVTNESKTEVEKVRCPDCYGTGSITTSHEFKHCVLCNGSGKIDKKKSIKIEQASRKK